MLEGCGEREGENGRGTIWDEGVDLDDSEGGGVGGREPPLVRVVSKGRAMAEKGICEV